MNMTESSSSLQPESGLMRSNLTVATGTAMSRVTGLIRIVIFGIVIGQTALADAFDVANNAPNAVYELLIGGVLSASLVPLFIRHLEDEDHEATESIISVTLVVLVVCTALAMLAAPLIFRLFSLDPAPSIDVEQFRRAGTLLTRIFLVQIFFYGISALATAVLNARRRFFAAAWSPVLANCVTIGFLLLIPLTTTDDPPPLVDVLDRPSFKWLLGLSSTLGVAAMGIFMVMAVRRSGIRWRFKPRFSHPAVRRLFALSMWTLGYVAANQIALVVIKNLASPGSGNVDAYSKAMILLQLPHGLLAVSIATTFIPDLARFAAKNDSVGFAQHMFRGVRLTAMLTFPAAVGLLVLSRPTIGLVLQHGNFSAVAGVNTSRALAGLSIGLIGFSLYLFALRGFYAHNDTRTPFFINLGENALNILFAFLLVGRYGVLGLGIAFSLAYISSAVVALIVLHHKVPEFDSTGVLGSLWSITLASGAMAAVVGISTRFIGSNSGWGALGRVTAGVAIGCLSYWLLLTVFQVRELKVLTHPKTNRPLVG
ncbi:MAG: murein biosynthesis integral membrane protein MurJ [Actinomycetota bacterium]